jgi:ABC transport system ATP-binding/permease protein
MWLLKTADEADPAFTFRILPGSVKTIGRSSGAEFIVDAAMVSRLHCQLTAGAAELEVVDLDSTNGTFVNGQRVKRGSLKEDDRLGVGRVELIVSR